MATVGGGGFEARDSQQRQLFRGSSLLPELKRHKCRAPKLHRPDRADNFAGRRFPYGIRAVFPLLISRVRLADAAETGRQ